MKKLFKSRWFWITAGVLVIGVSIFGMVQKQKGTVHKVTLATARTKDVVQKVKALKGAMGYNAATGEYEDLMKSGVIDPAKVTRTALQNAASVAGLLLTTEVLIAELPQKAEAPMPGGDHHGGGMDGMM